MLTVIMPTYNAETHIRDAIDSILNQTYRDFEFIIADDGSTDSTLEIIQSYAARDSRIRLLQFDHGGASTTRNRAVREATHPWVAMMDSDDVALPERLERQMAWAKKYPEVLMWGAGVSHINSRGDILSTFNVGPTSIEQFHKLIRAGRIVQITHPTMLVKRDIMLQVDGYDPRFVVTQDLEIMDRIADLGPIVCIPEVLLLYRIHTNSDSARKYFLQRKLAHYVMERRENKRNHKPEPTLEEFLERYNKGPIVQRIVRGIETRRAYYYRCAGLSYGERQYPSMLFYLTLAGIMGPGFTLKRAYNQVFSGRRSMSRIKEQVKNTDAQAKPMQSS